MRQLQLLADYTNKIEKICACTTITDHCAFQILFTQAISKRKRFKSLEVKLHYISFLPAYFIFTRVKPHLNKMHVHAPANISQFCGVWNVIKL